MGSDKKNIAQETSRWLRVGALTLTTLGPLVNIVITRLQERLATEELRDKEQVAVDTANQVHADLQEKIQAASGALVDVLAQLREQPHSQELLKHGEELTEELKHRWEKLSHIVAERGGEFSQDLARRSEVVAKEWGKRGREAQQGLAAQDKGLWIILGFGVGITTASIITFQLLRQRMLKRTQEELEPPIQLPYNGPLLGVSTGPTMDQSSSESINASSEYSSRAAQMNGKPSVVISNNVRPFTQSVKLSTSRSVTPADATLIGVVSTKHYYPAETPFGQLMLLEGESADVVYFASEEDAKAEGFSAKE